VDFQISEPAKKEFKFNEVISLTSVKPYVLRFWETEFIQINPSTNSEGEKIYTKDDILVIKAIKKLLFTDKMAIPEAKGALDKELELINSSAVLSEDDNEVVDIEGQSNDLKMALEEIINSHAIPNTESSNTKKIEVAETEDVINTEVITDSDEVAMEAESVTERVYANRTNSLAKKLKLEFKTHDRQLSNQDIVNLVNSKKKLSKLLGQITTLEEKYNW